MAIGKRNIRAVMDAGYDLGTESTDSSNNLGWTARVVLYFGNGITALTNYNEVCKDITNNYPYQDRVLVIPSFGAYLLTAGPTMTNTGLKHIHHQMQAQRGFTNLATYYSTSSPSRFAITGTGNGSGTYKTNNISMGDMRGHEYHTTSNGIWPSSQTGTLSDGVEYLYNTGAISVGSTS
tara:strand:+ start:592 stop:1128 length:537 start_codon:yes stop_codon:yes gene_type:complete